MIHDLEYRSYNLVQLYDEEGNAFYPVVHKDLIIGGVDDLDVGVTLSKFDLTQCITTLYTGTLMVKTFNNILYTMIIDLTTKDGEPFPLDTTIILGRDIPSYITDVKFQAIGDSENTIKVWLENSYLKARIVKRNKTDYSEYTSSIKEIVASGTMIK